MKRVNTMEKKQFHQNFDVVNYASLSIDLVNYFLAKCTLFMHRHRTRNQMKSLSPEQLSDMGISTEQLLEESRKPFWK